MENCGRGRKRHERHLPLGRSAVGLSPASGVVLLVLSVLLLFGCLCGIWRCRRPEVLPERGQRRCGELGQQTFMVVPKQGPKKPTSTLLDQVPGKPKEAAHARAQAAAGETAMSPMAPRPSHASKASKASSSRLARVVSAVSLLRPSKIHVVWQLNLQHVQDWLAGRTTIPPECVREAETQEETRAEPDADLEVASESCPQLPRQRSSALVASQHMAKPKKESNFFAAYSSGDKVEYFSATQGKWLLGEVHVQPVRGKTPFVYSVTLYRLAQQLPHVEQEMLRLPFAAGEPCELWSSSEERWIEAEIVGMEAGSTPVRQYKVQCLSGDPLLVQASMLRRCFPEGSQVRVYQGATQGFCHARVAGPSEAFRPNLEAQQSRTAPDGPLDYHVMVPILKASREKATVPSFFLRLERQLLGTRASADTKWKKTLAAKIGVAKRP